MNGRLALKRMISELRERMGGFSDVRKGKNIVYEVGEVGMAAFSVFFMQNPSFLEHQRVMKESTGRNNAEHLFGLQSTPSDNEIRNLLDSVSPDGLSGMYRWIFEELDRGQILQGMRSYGNNLLIALDGTWYFSSKEIHCANCSCKELADGSQLYFHSLITPVVVAPGNSHVVALEPEFILPQDGHEKQDCEMQAAKRWIKKHGRRYAGKGVTILGDDLFSKQPFDQLLQDHHFHFILVCKPDSHPILYETLDFLTQNGVLQTFSTRHWNGKQAEISTYRFANQVPLRSGEEAIMVNWCEIIVTQEASGKQIYHNAFVTDFPLSETTVPAVVRDGRTRWKVENENNNVLKTKGY
ncbi:MAG: ISNCY family transposase, partial [Candidatus Atribacteria bacterium]|nr:ISNCY family transposase [Candidatus Atribacteria bacterium]